MLFGLDNNRFIWKSALEFQNDTCSKGKDHDCMLVTYLDTNILGIRYFKAQLSAKAQ